jgi:hypothetical protein
VSLGAIGLDPVVIKRHLTGEGALGDPAHRLLPTVIAAVLIALVAAAFGRRWVTVLVEAARGGVIDAIALARLRAPPIAR